MPKLFHPRLWQGSVLCLLILFSGTSCTSTTDKSDAKAVARAFVSAVADGNAEQASQYVAQEERADFLAAMKRGMPDIPAGYEITVNIKGDTADVTTDDPSSLEFELIRRNDEWAVIK